MHDFIHAHVHCNYGQLLNVLNAKEQKVQKPRARAVQQKEVFRFLFLNVLLLVYGRIDTLRHRKELDWI